MQPVRHFARRNPVMSVWTAVCASGALLTAFAQSI